MLGTAILLGFKEECDIGNWCGIIKHNMVKNNLILGIGVLILGLSKTIMGQHRVISNTIW